VFRLKERRVGRFNTTAAAGGEVVGGRVEADIVAERVRAREREPGRQTAGIGVGDGVGGGE
jgi:hypothetical protein